MVFHRQRPSTLAVAALFCAFHNADASGFSVPEISVAGLGTSNAVVANPAMLGAVPYNPSLAAFHEGTTLTGGLTLVHADAQATAAAPNTVASTNFQGKDNVLIPNLSLTHRINDSLTLAFNTSVPFGLSTTYPVGFFDSIPAPLGGPAASPTKSQVEVVDLSPSLAFKIADNTSVAFGIDYYRVRKVAFDTGSLQNKGDGDAWGWNISASHTSGPWSLGASFRSHVAADIGGSTTVTGVGTFGGTSTTLHLPWRAQIGARYAVNEKLAMEADITRTGWSRFDVLSISHSSPFPLNPITSANQWNDANAYRLGGTYQLSGDTELRLGYTFDKTSMPDAFYSARIADADRHLFSIGMERQLGDGLAIEAGYMLVRFKEVNFNSATAQTTPDANGTSTYNAKYKTTVQLFGVGLSKRF